MEGRKEDEEEEGALAAAFLLVSVCVPIALQRRSFPFFLFCPKPPPRLCRDISQRCEDTSELGAAHTWV